MTLAARGMIWLLVYLAAAVAPLVFALLGADLEGRGFWREFATALGFVGLSLLGLQFVLVARIRPINISYGTDAVLLHHRNVGIVGFAFLLAHPAVLLLTGPRARAAMNPFVEPTGPAPILGWTALALLTVLVATSIWRVRLGLGYEAWRVAHGVLAVVVVGASLGHATAVGNYLVGPFRTGLWLAMAAVVLGGTAYVRIVKPWMLLRRPYRIERIRRERGDARSLLLRPDGHEGTGFQPGQFAWLTIDRSPFGIREHPFSFSSSAETTDRLEFTVKALGDFTSRLDRLEPGTIAYVDGPYGVFTHERQEASTFVFLAGGVGITPIMSMLRTLADREDRRPMVLLYGNPTWDEVIFRDELEDLRGRLDLRVVHVLEEPPDGWEGEAGFITAEVLERHLPERPELAQYFLCGPPPMVEAVEEALAAHDVPAERIEIERFDLI